MSNKGGAFEREICKQLSRWWTTQERDDIFWRSSQSGGRATQRGKSGKPTFGSYGDITATDPIGQPLLRIFTIELKTGKSHGHPADLLDLPVRHGLQKFEKTLLQAQNAAAASGSFTWLLICRRLGKLPMAYLRRKDIQNLGLGDLLFAEPPAVTFRIWVNRDKKGPARRMSIYGCLLSTFLEVIYPAAIIECAKVLNTGNKIL